MNDKCDICRGRGTIQLSRWLPMQPIGPAEYTPENALATSVATFPCPQCSTESIGFNRIDVFTRTIDVPEHINRDPKFMSHLHGCMAHELAEEMIKRGHVEVTRGKENFRESREGLVSFRGRIAVVAKQSVATMEERIAKRQMDVARELVEATIEEIRNWNSYYTGRDGGHVHKDDAIRWLRDALKKVREAREEL